MKYLIVGLGNIGVEYENTRHNVGFKIVDKIALDKGVKFTSERYGSVCEVRHKGRVMTFLKPSTYMNLSGNAVRYWMQQLKIEADRVFVLVDDIAIPFGSIRIRKKGSDGGHNGLKHINEILAHQNYPRLRFGIGGDFTRGSQVNYVLGEWSDQEIEALPILLEHCQKSIESFCLAGIDKTMNTYNKK